MIYKCNFCDNKTNSLKAMKYHIQIHFTEAQSQYPKIKYYWTEEQEYKMKKHLKNKR